MSRVIWFILTSFLLIVTSANAVSVEDLVKKYRQGVVYIKVQKVNPINGAISEEHGTGFIVNKSGYVLTSDHVVAASGGLQTDVRGAVGSAEGTLEGMEVVFESTNFDVALLKFKNTAIERTELPLGDPWAVPDGDSLYAMGFPGKEEWFHTEGKLSGKVGPKGSWNTTLSLNPGMSGGPVFDSRGGVVAMVWGGVPTAGIVGINRIMPVNLMPDALRIGGATTQSASAPPPDQMIEIRYTLDQTQETLGGVQAASRSYSRKFNAQPGYKIVDYKLVTKSTNNADITTVEVSSDRKSISITFSLRSGPIFDRWRGWLSAEVLTRQQPE
ncbi:serine protease [Cupriavidus necator]|uniref:S1 family peptidase n=1 Tax=Cupriavidus necator TaxID=106590 RepID=UPI0039C4D25B